MQAGRNRSAAAAEVVTDSVALLAFVVIGVLNHGGTPGAGSIARNAVPVLAAWLAASVALGTYRRGGAGRLLATWGVAVPAGVALRGALLGRDFDAGFLVFLAVALAFTFLFLATGRLLLIALSYGGRSVLR